MKVEDSRKAAKEDESGPMAPMKEPRDVISVLVAVRGAEQPVVVVVQLLVQRRRIGPRRARCEHVVTRRMNRHHASASPIVVAIQPLLFPIATFNIEATRELKIVMVLCLAPLSTVSSRP